ncbi:hypothetical protein GCM10027020_09640 [Nocardioides salsibiostraticola]
MFARIRWPTMAAGSDALSIDEEFSQSPVRVSVTLVMRSQSLAMLILSLVVPSISFQRMLLAFKL